MRGHSLLRRCCVWVREGLECIEKLSTPLLRTDFHPFAGKLYLERRSAGCDGAMPRLVPRFCPLWEMQQVCVSDIARCKCLKAGQAPELADPLICYDQQEQAGFGTGCILQMQM